MYLRIYTTSSRNRNPVNWNYLGILQLRIGLLCEIMTKRRQMKPPKIGTRLPQKCWFVFRGDILYCLERAVEASGVN